MGTHGGGHQYEIVRLFSTRQDKLIQCKSFIKNKEELVIGFSKTHQSGLAYDSLLQELSYTEFKSDDETGFYKPTYNTTALRLVNGEFITKPYSIPTTSRLPEGTYYRSGRIVFQRGYNATDYNNKEIAIILKGLDKNVTGAVKCSCTDKSHHHSLGLKN